MDRQKRLLKHEFEASIEIDSKRTELAKKSDELFNEIMRSTGSIKTWAIKQFERHNEVVKAFLGKNRAYFTAKRAHYLQFSGLGALGRYEKEEAGDIELRKAKGARTMVWAIFIAFALSGCTAFAQVSEKKAVLAIIGEAENQGYEGMLAVAGAIRNRGSLRGVYGLKSKRVRLHLYSQKTFELAQTAWIESESIDESNGGTGWGNEDDINKFCSTTWWPKCVITAHIGDHWFYRKESK